MDPVLMSPASDGEESVTGSDILLEGWDALASGWLVLDMVIVLLLALLLGAIIGYHPSTRRSVSSLEDYEQPKACMIYAVVAAVVALIVKVQPAMAFVIFGIGGLLRFRTLVGEAKDTGRVILVTVVGLCCGLKVFVVAIPATVIGWFLILALEQKTAGIIRVSGVSEQAIHDATMAYRQKITGLGCTVIGEQTKFIKREFLFVVSVPQGVGRDTLEAAFEGMPEEVRGVVDFERM